MSETRTTLDLRGADSPTGAAAQPNSAGRERELAAQIEQLQLEPIQRAYLRERWLGQLAYLGRAARRDQRWYYTLRLVTILGGVAIPSLVGLNVGGSARETTRWLTFGLGLLVATATGLEAFFRWGERWHHFRQQAELLWADGWAFLELAGPAYRRFDSHAAAFPAFVARVEAAIRQEVGVYIAEVTRAQEPGQQPGDAGETGPSASEGQRPDGPVADARPA